MKLFDKTFSRTLVAFVCMLLVLSSCAPRRKPAEEIPAEEVKAISFEISRVSASPRQFNPTKGEEVTISYELPRPAKSILKIFDPNMYLIREMVARDFQNLDKVDFTWNGRDSRGNIVPDEAYFFTIEAFDLKKDFARYDPSELPQEHLPNLEVNFHEQRGLLEYELIRDARIKIHAGIRKGGPLLKTILNWKPRLAGRYQQQWDGKDESGTVKIVGQPNFGISAQSITLLENSIIAVGNGEYSYSDYLRKIAPDRPKKGGKTPPISSQMEWLGLPFRLPDLAAARPQFSLKLPGDFPKTKDGLPMVKGEVPVVIRLEEKTKRYILEQQFEILCFVDFTFVKEEEEGYSPATWLWDTKIHPNGEHVLTVNVATFSGQVSTSSLKVFVQN